MTLTKHTPFPPRLIRNEAVVLASSCTAIVDCFPQIVLFLFLLCLTCMIGSVVWEFKTGWYFQTYLPWDSLVPSERTTGSITIGTLVFFSYAIVLNTLVPISLYVRCVCVRARVAIINRPARCVHVVLCVRQRRGSAFRAELLHKLG